MKPLNVTLIHRDNDGYRQLCGWWSYPVPEFTWKAVKVQQVGFRAAPKPDADIIFMDDWIFGQVDKRGKPLVYWIIDAERSSYQVERNRKQAAQADLILVDSARLDHFSDIRKTRRLAYAVNEQLYHPREKEYDVSFLCWPTPERRLVQYAAERICKYHGWSFLSATYTNQLEYAEAIGKAKIVIHKQHVPNSRSWRVFDVMASGCCLLSSVLPIIDGDGIQPGTHYLEYNDEVELQNQLIRLMSGEWESIAQAGHDLVMERHTWKTRSAELREIVHQEFGL